MQEKDYSGDLSFFGRVSLGLKLMFNADFARELLGVKRVETDSAGAALTSKPTPVAPERQHASALSLLAALQREGRFVDFLQQDVASFSDEEVGAASRVVHTGCQKVLKQCLEIEPVSRDEEGAAVTVPTGFDSQRYRLTGNVSGAPPFKGTLKHHGWVAKELKFPEVSGAVDPRVLAPAEVEI